MLSAIIYYALPGSATLLIACVLSCLLGGLYLFIFNLRNTNQVLRHPYLATHNWEQLPLSLKLSVLLDYFLRLNFPKQNKWIFGQANRLLAHVNTDEVPMNVKWPLMSFWGGCFLGIACMLCLWILLALLSGLN